MTTNAQQTQAHASDSLSLPAALTGRVHSIDTCSTVDGPGIRTTVFMQGCLLRCQYCHNPDTWPLGTGQVYTVAELMHIIQRQKPYFAGSGGGVTASGGEPLLQSRFLVALFEACQRSGIHTTLDTNGYWQEQQSVEALLDVTDLIMLDIKDPDLASHLRLIGCDPAPIWRFLDFVANRGKRLWIRHVLVPGYTLELHSLRELAILLKPYQSAIEKVDFLGYHQLGLHKWATMGMTSALETTPAVTEAERKQAEALFNQSYQI